MIENENFSISQVPRRLSVCFGFLSYYGFSLIFNRIDSVICITRVLLKYIDSKRLKDYLLRRALNLPRAS